MIKVWFGILGLLALPALSLAQVDDDQFRQIALLVLEQRLEQNEKAMSNGLLNQICQETHLPDTVARMRLLGLLDSLEGQRKGKGPAWKSLLAVAKQHGPPKQAEKLLRQLNDSIRKVLLTSPDQKGSDYDLKTLVADAEQNTQFEPGQGREMLLQMLSLGSHTTVPRLAGVPQQISLLVEVATTPSDVASLAAADPLVMASAQSKLPHIPPILLPSLIQDLPSSSRVRSAVAQSQEQLPDYRLVVTLEELRDSYNGGLMQEITLIAQISLTSLKNETQVYQRPVIIKRYTSTGKVLDPMSKEFCDEAAGRIRRALDAYLSAR